MTKAKTATPTIPAARLEAFSDGVMAIIITIIVLEIKVPHEPTLHALRPLLPIFLAYALSFRQVGTFWNNHHHLLKLTRTVTPKIMWANLNLLFFLSLTPFVTLWWGENIDAAWPIALFGINALLCGLTYRLLQSAILASHDKAIIKTAGFGNDYKGNMSLAAYAIATPLAFMSPWISIALFITVAVIWVIPDRRVETVLEKE